MINPLPSVSCSIHLETMGFKKKITFTILMSITYNISVYSDSLMSCSVLNITPCQHDKTANIVIS